MGNAATVNATDNVITMPDGIGKVIKEESKIDSVNEIHRKIGALMIEHGYPSELKKQSPEELATYCVELFHVNINWTSTTYYAQSTDIKTIHKKSKKECYDHFVDTFKVLDCSGFKTKIQKQKINGSSCKISVEIELIDVDEKLKGRKMFMEDTFTWNQNGHITELNSICREYND